MSPSAKEPEFWDEIANEYDDYPGMADFVNETRPWLQAQFAGGENVLELGCGTGIFSELIADRVGHLTATDMSPQMLAQATKKLSRYSNVRIQREDAHHISFDDNTFDSALLANVLHHMDTPVAVVRECNRVLRLGGKIVTIDATSYGISRLGIIGTVFRFLKRRGLWPSSDESLSVDQAVAIMKEAEFVVQEAELKPVDNKHNAVRLRGTKAS